MSNGTSHVDGAIQALESDVTLSLSASGVIKFIEASEYELIQLMIGNNIWINTGPVSDPGGSGDIEFGLLPYWINNPPSFVQDYVDSSIILKAAWDLLKLFLKTQIDEANYAALVARAEGEGLVGNDGTIFGDQTYDQMDPRWMWAFLNYLYVCHANDKAPFSTTAVQPIVIESPTDPIRIALVGDWGTGSGAAAPVMQQIMGLNPDYLIHLGDVYYAGTGGDFLPLNEEQDNFLNLWPTDQRVKGRSFMLNSNHEMYSGAKGYFNVALADPRFSAQNKTSYFALQYAGWTIIGLDSAYYSTAPMFMGGSLGAVNGTQAAWVQGLKNNGKKLSPDQVIILTHHNGLNYDGSVDFKSALWSQVNSALGGDPAAWYWGHIHNAIVYNTPTVTGSNTLARCVGHGAIPFGSAWGLANVPAVAYYANTSNPNAPPCVYNGFALLTIFPSGDVTEEFYQLSTSDPLFSKTYKLGAGTP